MAGAVSFYYFSLIRHCSVKHDAIHFLVMNCCSCDFLVMSLQYIMVKDCRNLTYECLVFSQLVFVWMFYTKNVQTFDYKVANT